MTLSSETMNTEIQDTPQSFQEERTATAALDASRAHFDNVIKRRERMIANQSKRIEEQGKEIADLHTKVNKLNAENAALKNTVEWKEDDEKTQFEHITGATKKDG